METLLRDLKHALRMFREGGASFVVTALLALGLGIRANTAIFSLVNAVLLKEPPFPKVVISEGLWKRRFGGNPAILGKTMVLGGEPAVITGVVNDRFDFQDFGAAPEVWVPFQLDPNSTDQGHYFQAAARLKGRVSLAQARELHSR